MPAVRPRLAVPMLALLALLALLAVGSVVPAQAQGPEARVQVALSETGCDPTTISVPAGPVVFEITNLGGDVGEFEILDGDFVVDEVENIVPGFQSDLATRLDGGRYAVVCYSPQAQRGTLSVTGAGDTSRPPSDVVDPATLTAYQAEYETYVRAQSRDFVARVATFAAAIKAGDLETARSLYASTRIPWETIGPIAELFSDLDRSVNFRAADFAGVDDPAWTGFHRIERILWVGGASGDLDALADGLLADARDLDTRLATLSVDPYLMAQGAGALIDEIAETTMTGGGDRYSGTDLVSIQAHIDGSRKIIDILRPTLDRVAPDYLAQLDAAFAAVDDILSRYRDGDVFRAFGDVTAADLTAMQSALAGLAETLSPLAGTLGLTA